MIVVNISSGLGNQLFQYAAGRALSLHHGVKLLGDPISYAPRFESLTSRSSKREFFLKELDLHIDFRLVPGSYLTTIRGYSRIRRLLLDWKRKKYSCSGTYDEAFSSLGKNVLLDGYFQDLKYLLNYKDKIFDEISIALSSFANHHTYDDKMIDGDTVAALHVRRGDYFNHPELYPEWFEEYTLSIAPYLLEEFSLKELHVFTDDENWCRQEFRPLGEKIKIMSADKRYEGACDLIKMSKYPILAIANSTFSCWAAYLSSVKLTQVIAPGRWSTWCTEPQKSLYMPSWKVYDI